MNTSYLYRAKATKTGQTGKKQTDYAENTSNSGMKAAAYLNHIRAETQYPGKPAANAAAVGCKKNTPNQIPEQGYRKPGLKKKTHYGKRRAV
ncbi:hypothetical protein [Neisseria perflava]|uniref:hypothetical protein n=1 Tax=Neisseria perflava TaxID=33053 RepID=UPI00209D36B5|nr:hypothetical protein [Neisseria perflava]MCP1659128.1 hypothetical protein [Neisseria perflava]MCP1771375.1 hypothetical protein [Neisseria perflava]